MSFVITAPCIGDFSCVEICPVNCISPGPHDEDFDRAEQIYIDPDACIGCGVCVEACPVLAIYEADALPVKYQHYAQINRDYFIQRGGSIETNVLQKDTANE